MLSPSTLERLPDGLTDLVNELQTEIIKAAARKITKANYLTPSGEWLMYKAQMLQSGTNEVNRLISRYTGLSRREVKSLYTDSCMKAIANDAKIYRMAGKDASSFFRSVAFSNALKAGIRNANGLMNNITCSMVQSSRSTVTHLMDKAYVMVLSGAFSQSEAIYSAVKELADKGIQSVRYSSGKSDWADVAVRRAVLTGIGQTTGRMQLDLAAEMESDLVEVTSHGGARPSHAEWQGRVYSISGKSKKYPPLSRTGYGTGDGLKGWNCRHDFYPFFEGISERASFPVDIAENQKEYEASQRQRAIERSIRSSKRGLAALDSAIQSTDDDELKAKLQRQFDRKSNTLKNQEARLAEHCKSSGLLTRPDRTRVVGFGRSVGQKAVHGNRRYIKRTTGQGKSNKNDDSLNLLLTAGRDNGIINLDDYYAKIIGEHSIGDDIGTSKSPICNPHNKSILSPRKYKENCCNCAVAFELRRRGYDVEALGGHGIQVKDWKRLFANNTSTYHYVEEEGLSPLENVTKQLMKHGEGARGSIFVEWKTKEEGHYFSWEIKNGEIRFVDSQNGLLDVSSYFDRVIPSSIIATRWDNLKPRRLITVLCKDKR